MSVANQYRWSGYAVIIAGVLYAAQAIIGVVKPQGEVFTSPSDYAIEIAFVVALVLTLFGLVGIRQAAKGVFGTVSFLLLFLGIALLTISAGATLAAGRDVLGGLFLPAVGLAAIGSILMGIALIRSKIAPVWSSIALMAGFPLSVALGDLGGGIALGVAWVVIGAACLSKLAVSAHDLQLA